MTLGVKLDESKLSEEALAGEEPSSYEWSFYAVQEAANELLEREGLELVSVGTPADGLREEFQGFYLSLVKHTQSFGDTLSEVRPPSVGEVTREELAEFEQALELLGQKKQRPTLLLAVEVG